MASDSTPESAPPPVEGAPASHPLLGLQELDLSLDRLKARLGQLESQEEVMAARDRAAQVEASLGEAQLSIDSVSREQGRLEGTLEALSQKIVAESGRLFNGSVANAKELQSIQAEVEGLKSRKSRMEDELLDLMERREGLDEHRAKVEAELNEARDRLAEIEATSGREVVEIDRALGERSAERKTLVDAIDPDLHQLYEELRPQKKGVAAVALMDGVCQGCHQKLSAVYLDRLKRAEGVRRCEYCRRILVFG